MAHKKAAWSAKNLRDSNPQYRGVKLFWGQVATAGAVIIRQKWDKFAVGAHTYKGRDFTIHAAKDGVVQYSKKNVVRFDWRRYLKTFVHIVDAQDASVLSPSSDDAEKISAWSAKSWSVDASKPAKKVAPKTSLKTSPKTSSKTSSKSSPKTVASSPKPQKATKASATVEWSSTAE
jgi:large subunit ribosomal protein L27